MRLIVLFVYTLNDKGYIRDTLITEYDTLNF